MLFLAAEGFSTVRILTFHYNQADFVEMQYKALRKFLEDDFELIVFNDARTPDNEQGIKAACDKHGIKCVRFEPEWHFSDPLNSYLQSRLQEKSTVPIWGWNASTSITEIANNPSVRHSHVIQYALDHYGYNHDDIVVIMDGDCFVLKPLSIRELLGSDDLIAFNQRNDPLGAMQISVLQGEEMFWVVFMAFCPSKLPNPRELHLNVDVISGCHHLPENTLGDTGAAVYKYLQKYPHLRTTAYYWQYSWVFRKFTNKELKEMGFNKFLIHFIYAIAPGDVQLFLRQTFMHFGAVSAEDVNHKQKVRCLAKLMDELLKST
ncbi:MAG TPA: hypothetical protein VLF94_04095 [Chlamydiales bacterium]|nr:hypothetical protein [Chlamydiales bacterium]